MIWAGLLLAWALGAASIYWTDADLRATQEDRAAYAALWPVFAILIVILLSVAGAGRIYGAIRAIRAS